MSRKYEYHFFQQFFRSVKSTTVSGETVRNWQHTVDLYDRRLMMCVTLIARHRDAWREWETEYVNRGETNGVIFFSLTSSVFLFIL